MKSLNDIIWNEDIDLEEEKNGDIQFGDDPRLEQSCGGLNSACIIRKSKHPNATWCE
ncbi:hypothetical protein KQI38_08150 [Tissierella carlieri]|uniref:hypothetical protein n=1 Tax=Tissierella carlieri TaxID=689904 RepID=UPI001C126C70|nr:hypothetical protein [Tissierella carlieri]MBU5311995.1 hypothetical protein [Tissierella carlieri]MDU5083530.1 hypothetical protein [Bacillota bacterium]